MDRPVAYRGSQLTVVYAVCANGSCPGLEFYENLSVRDKAKVNKLFQWLGDFGWIRNDQKFKPLQGTGLFEFKSFQIRMPCFRSGDLMIITHGFFKKTGATPSEEIKRALRIQAEDAGLDALRSRSRRKQNPWPT